MCSTRDVKAVSGGTDGGAAATVGKAGLLEKGQLAIEPPATRLLRRQTSAVLGR
jgi:hypothetical protein